MSLSRTEVAKAQKLARLRFQDHEQDYFIPHLNRVLDWIKQLKDINVQNVEPLVTPDEFIESTPIRKDQITDGECAKEVLSNATDAVHGFFSVPKVVE